MIKKFLSFTQVFEIESRLIDSLVTCSPEDKHEVSACLNEAEVVRLVLALLNHPTASYLLGESVLFRLANLLWENYGKD